MALKEQIQQLASVNETPCVTISLNTHRTRPDNAKDELQLKNLLKEAKERVLNEFGKREVASLLEKIDSVSDDIDSTQNLDSLHLFLSNSNAEIVRTAWPINQNGVHMSNGFALRPLIKAYGRTEHYLLMQLSQSGVSLFEAMNDGIVGEISNDDFPFSENQHYNTNKQKASDAKHLDNLVREYLNKVDKALVKVHNETGLKCVVICTEDNYSRLQQVATRPDIYIDYANINYNAMGPHQLVNQSWEIIQNKIQSGKAKAIAEVKEGVAQGRVSTDLQEIYRAAKNGQGELLVVHVDFAQAALLKQGDTLELITDPTQENAVDDIGSNIVWEVLSKNGRVVFTSMDEIKDLGEIVLKRRF